MPRTLQETQAALADIDAHVEHVAIKTQPESDMNILAYAIHNLIDIVRELAEQPRP